jgi:hypothetical protein
MDNKTSEPKLCPILHVQDFLVPVPSKSTNIHVVDNFGLLRGLFGMPLEDDEFFFVQILTRPKDGHKVSGDNKNRMIRFYCVKTPERLEELKPEIEMLCCMYNARAYIHPTPRSEKMVAASMLEDAVHEFTAGNYHMFRRLYSTACGQTYVTGKKKFVVDLDRAPSEDGYLWEARQNVTRKIINSCRGKAIFPKNPTGEDTDKVYMVVPTKNGVHLITTPFDVGQMEQRLKINGWVTPEVHKNNPTLLYYRWEEP